MLDVGSDPDSDPFTTFFNTFSINKNNKMQRRFTNQQIKSLETIFQSDSKLEPRKKLQLAQDLGLQPRQVAIWFQNKRARWKSKQLEKDYNLLRANYDSLATKFDILNKENQSLSLQLKKLQEVFYKKEKSCDTMGNSSDSKEDKASEKGLGNVSDADSSMKQEYQGCDDNILVEMVEKGTDGNWDDLESDQLLNESTIGNTGNQWWDIWC